MRDALRGRFRMLSARIKIPNACACPGEFYRLYGLKLSNIWFLDWGVSAMQRCRKPFVFGLLPAPSLWAFLSVVDGW